MKKELKAQDKKPLTVEGERTKEGPVFVPSVDIYEAEDGMTLVADMPGVEKDGLTVDLKDDTLTIRGEVRKTDTGGLKLIFSEYEEGDYYRQFSLSEVIDQEKITAALKDGVLTVFLPKTAPAKPRRIDIAAE
ncbi:MAG: Hsp20/alpha crystallin family protein [Pseudomonadota bacterium]